MTTHQNKEGLEAAIDLLKTRDGESFDGEVHLTSAEAQAIAEFLSSLREENESLRNAFEMSAQESSEVIIALEQENERLGEKLNVAERNRDAGVRNLLTMQGAAAELAARLKLTEETIGFVRRWAIDKEGNGTSAEERLSAITHHPGVARAALSQEAGKL